MGSTERAQEVELQQRELDIARARQQPAKLPGPVICVQCKCPNDRARAGFAVCTSCMAEAGK